VRPGKRLPASVNRTGVEGTRDPTYSWASLPGPTPAFHDEDLDRFFCAYASKKRRNIKKNAQTFSITKMHSASEKKKKREICPRHVKGIHSTPAPSSLSVSPIGKTD
jgi:hypothetical protein